MAFLLEEEKALKDHLSGMTVADDRSGPGGRPVLVRYRLPQKEEGPIQIPMITIDLIDIIEEIDRAHRGRIRLRYQPDGYVEGPAGTDALTEFPIPVSLIFQVRTFCRHSWHDRQLQARILNEKLPFRYGALVVPTAEEGVETIRRVDLLDVQPVDGLDANRKRLFSKAYTIAVSSEMFTDAILAVPRVTTPAEIRLFHQMTTFEVEIT